MVVVSLIVFFPFVSKSDSFIVFVAFVVCPLQSKPVAEQIEGFPPHHWKKLADHFLPLVDDVPFDIPCCDGVLLLYFGNRWAHRILRCLRIEAFVFWSAREVFWLDGCRDNLVTSRWDKLDTFIIWRAWQRSLHWIDIPQWFSQSGHDQLSLPRPLLIQNSHLFVCYLFYRLLGNGNIFIPFFLAASCGPYMLALKISFKRNCLQTYIVIIFFFLLISSEKGSLDFPPFQFLCELCLLKD